MSPLRRSPGRRRGGVSLARQLLWLQALVVAVLVAAASAVAYLDAREAVQSTAEERTTAVVESIADSPLVVEAVTGEDPTAVLQPYVEQVRADAGLSFVTVMAPDRTRFTHPDPAQIGRPFRGSVAEALAGRTLTETYTGTLGPSVRSTGPVLDADGDVVALVSAGITVDRVGADLAEAVPGILGTAALALTAGALGSWAISRRVRRQTGGLDATTLARMVEHHEAVLHAVREGLLLVDREGRVELANDEARRLLDLDGDPAGRPVTALGLPGPLATALAAPGRAVDEVHLSGSRVLLVNRSPTRAAGRSAGSVVTLRDHTELQALTGERDSVRAFADSLRAQAHEAANRLHTTVSLVELGRSGEAVEFATASLATAQALTDRVVGAVEEPVLAALLLGKAAGAAERGVTLEIDPGTAVGVTGLPAGDLVTVVGNLLDNAVDAALAGDPPREVAVGLAVDGDRLEIRVEDSGPGVPEEQAAEVFRRGFTTKPPPDGAPEGLGRGLGLALVEQTVRRHGGTVSVRPGPGAEFTVSLPLAVPARTAP
ncbi:Sensor histidine kinase regulating citrate/malate metabolism [Geodermatophilus saharensis]|uniref:histidine kinase n=1 Tax=Geodermatophilus saharensis TaxID=1137994 RepID=A0A239CSP0_9ACTN|nr:sensor histidine kinase [Geodermatophilus saharensis]SNS22534.1 Sensor histidine kinase regulating citrate/malate metabolism [Geodermatophilus saharensis]